jgi:hypothetical protein
VLSSATRTERANDPGIGLPAATQNLPRRLEQTLPFTQSRGLHLLRRLRVLQEISGEITDGCLLVDSRLLKLELGLLDQALQLTAGGR